MALTVNTFVGFESGGLEEATGGTSGSPDATEATIVRSGDRSLRLPDGNHSYTIDLFNEVADAGTGHVFGFGLYLVTGVTPSISIEIARARDSAGQRIAGLLLRTDGTLRLDDDTGGGQVSGTTVLTPDTWHYIEVYFEAVGSNGDSELFIDGVSEGTGSTGDFLNGTLDDFVFSSASALDGAMLIDDFYWLSGVTAASDRLGTGVSVYGYQPGKTGAVSDFDSAGVAGGDNLENSSTWPEAGNRPWFDPQAIQYTGSGQLDGCIAFSETNANGDGPGPSSGSDIVSGTIKAAKYIFRGDRSGGSGTTHSIVYGKYDGVGDMDDAPQIDTVSLLSGTLTNFFVVTEAAAEVPTASEDFVMGLDKSSGGRDWDCYEMQAFLLHVSNTTVTDLSDGLMPEFPSHGLTVEV